MWYTDIHMSQTIELLTSTFNKQNFPNISGSYDTKRDFEMLAQEMGGVEKGRNNRLFYLALPPSVFKPVTTMIKVWLFISFLQPFLGIKVSETYNIS